jgi:hypothetical protein
MNSTEKYIERNYVQQIFKRLCGVYFSIGNGSREVFDADVGTSGPSRWNTTIHYGCSLQIFEYLYVIFSIKRGCAVMGVLIKVKSIPSIY